MSDPDAAQRAFYTAFESADLEAMTAVWADDPDVLCIHPLGAVLLGAEAVREGWRLLFTAGEAMRFRVRVVAAWREPALATYTVEEHIEAPSAADGHALVLATNVFRLHDGQWRMVLHHGSPAPRQRPPVASVH